MKGLTDEHWMAETVKSDRPFLNGAVRIRTVFAWVLDKVVENFLPSAYRLGAFPFH